MLKQWLQRPLNFFIKASSDSKNPADKDQASGSPLFIKLPAELRLQIYKEIFQGSKTRFRQRYVVYRTMFRRLVIGRRTYQNVLLPTHHHNFLLTCRQAYSEARETYWSETILYGDSSDATIFLLTQSVVPDVAKPHLKHIRGLSHGLLDGWDSVHQYLQDFVNLQTICLDFHCIFDMTPWLGQQLILPAVEDLAEVDFQRDLFTKYLQRISSSDPALMGRVTFRRGVIEGSRLVEGPFKQDGKVCFYNFGTGKVFHADGHDIEDEEAGFAKVLDD